MFVLQEVAESIEKTLNTIDSDYEFSVATQGFHIDKIANHKSGKNFIPVFVTLASGENEPIPNLSMSSYEINVVIYFPVRFKNDFFLLQDKLNKAYCGQVVELGVLTGKCVSNISVASYGEIQDLDLNEFKEWVENVYKKEISVNEPFQTMEFSLFFGTVKKGIPFGNNIKYLLSYKYTKYDPNLKKQVEISMPQVELLWDNVGSETETSTIGQQLFEYARQGVLPNITTRARSILVYADDNDTIATLFKLYNLGQLDTITELKLTKEIDASDRYSGAYEYDNVLISFNESVERGSPLSATLTFGDKAYYYGN